MKAKTDELMEKAGHAIRENVAHIIFGAVILLMVVISFVDMGKGDGIINWFDLVVNITLQLSVFIPYRWRQKRITGQASPFIDNKKTYADKINEIHKDNELKEFAKFCKVKTDELKKEKQLAIVQAAGLDSDVYELLITAKLTAEQKKERAEIEASLTPEQRKALERAQRVKVKPVNPLCITSNSSKVKGYGIDFDDTVEDACGILFKIFPMIVWSVILAWIAIDSLKYGGITAVVMIIFRVVMCLTAMFSGIMSGDGFVIKKDKVILRRIDFIELFHEWVGREESIKTIELPLPELPDDITVKSE